MHMPFKRIPSSVSNLDNFNFLNWLSFLFAVWLLLSVTTDDAIYRSFFHILIYPLTIYLIIKKYKKFIWKDYFIRLFFIFCGYMAITTWLVGNDAPAGNIQALRWSFEAFIGIFAYWLCMQNVVLTPRRWGRWFLFLAWIGSCVGMLSSLSEISLNHRIGGLGMMEHPLPGASTAVILLATGLWLTYANNFLVTRKDFILTVISIISAFIFVTFSQSRAPQFTLLIYLIFFGLLVSYQYRKPSTIYIISSIFTGIILIIHWFIGFDLLYQQVMERGASYRLDIWTAIFNHPPESFLFGHGAGLDFRSTDAAKIGLNDVGFEIYHPHNIWLGAFMDTGLIGVTMQAGLLALPLAAILRSSFCIVNKLHMLAILGLFVLLTLTDEYTLITSPRPIWLIGWIPLVFVWSWCRYRHQDHS